MVPRCFPSRFPGKHFCRKYLILLVPGEGFEPPTNGLQIAALVRKPQFSLGRPAQFLLDRRGHMLPPRQADGTNEVRCQAGNRGRTAEYRQTTDRVVPEARGRVAQITQAAEAYREQTVAEATGQAVRFLKIYDQYKNAPEVTRQRMYLEMMERLFGGTDKVIVDTSKNAGGSGVVPYLPFNKPRADAANGRQQIKLQIKLFLIEECRFYFGASASITASSAAMASWNFRKRSICLSVSPGW